MQSRLESTVEALLNIGSGFIISLLLWTFVIVPVWDLPVKMHDNLAITSLFTVVSIVRSYIWRRIFNRILVKRYKKVREQLGLATWFRLPDGVEPVINGSVGGVSTETYERVPLWRDANDDK